MLHSYVVSIFISIVRKRIYFKILDGVNEGLLKSAPISTITKWQGQSFGTYNKNINNNGDACRYIYKINHPR